MTCKSPKTPPGGIIVDGEADVYLPGMEIAYACQKGYRIIQGGSVVCSKLGAWFGSFIVCKGDLRAKFAVSLVEPQAC